MVSKAFKDEFTSKYACAIIIDGESYLATRRPMLGYDEKGITVRVEGENGKVEIMAQLPWSSTLVIIPAGDWLEREGCR